MRKDVFIICILFFMLCMIIGPGTASLSDNSIAGKNGTDIITSVPIQAIVISETVKTGQLNDTMR